ncbi:hypothetical protein M758_UG322800 [Ceratodon purpureus]|nr:hypothetical protein M758_UG322800 [Ceratodon purpureus]
MNMPLLHEMLRIHLPLAMRQTPTVGTHPSPVAQAASPATLPIVVNDSPFVASPGYFAVTSDLAMETPPVDHCESGLSPQALNAISRLSMARVIPLAAQNLASASDTPVPSQVNGRTEGHLQSRRENVFNAEGGNQT